MLKYLSIVSVVGGFVIKDTRNKIKEETRIITATGIIPVPPTVYPDVCQFCRKKNNHSIITLKIDAKTPIFVLFFQNRAATTIGKSPEKPVKDHIASLKILGVAIKEIT